MELMELDKNITRPVFLHKTPARSTFRAFSCFQPAFFAHWTGNAALENFLETHYSSNTTKEPACVAFKNGEISFAKSASDPKALYYALPGFQMAITFLNFDFMAIADRKTTPRV